MALLFGTQAINAGMMGPIAIFVLCVVAAFEWKEDNYKKVCIKWLESIHGHFSD
jgi:hypothetical protein